MNIWYSRKTAKDELRETLFFSGMNHKEWTKDANGYEIETEMGTLRIRSMYDVRLNGHKVGSVTDMKREVGRWLMR